MELSVDFFRLCVGFGGLALDRGVMGKVDGWRWRDAWEYTCLDRSHGGMRYDFGRGGSCKLGRREELEREDKKSGLRDDVTASMRRTEMQEANTEWVL